MKIEKGKISNLQLTILFAALILASDPALANAGAPAKNNGWLAFLVAIVMGSIIIYIFTSLSQKFPGKNLVQINSLIYGRYLGSFISICYLWYFCHLASNNIWYNSAIYVNTILKDTPEAVIYISFILITAYALRKGLEVITRSVVFLFLLIVVIIIISEFLLLKEMKIKYLLPIMDIPMRDFLVSTFSITTLNFGESIVFLMIMGRVTNVKILKKSVFMGLIIGSGLLLLISLTTTMVLGPVESIAFIPSFHMYRLINVGDIFTRMEALLLGMLQAMAFIRISLFLYGAVMVGAQLFNMRSYLPLVLPVAIIAGNIAYLQRGVELRLDYGVNTLPYYSLPYELIIPLISLILASVKEKRYPKE